jgi:hypothetical protein
MARISLFGIAAVLVLTGITVWVSSSHSAVEAPIETAQVDPFSLTVNAKNLPSQESLTLKMWPDNGLPITDPDALDHKPNSF